MTLNAALDFGPAQRLAFECANGHYDKGDFSYETLSQRSVDQSGNAVPTAIALTWGVGSLDENTVPDIAAKAENTGNLRFVRGMTAEEATSDWVWRRQGKRTANCGLMETKIIILRKAAYIVIFRAIGNEVLKQLNDETHKTLMEVSCEYRTFVYSVIATLAGVVGNKWIVKV